MSLCSNIQVLKFVKLLTQFRPLFDPDCRVVSKGERWISPREDNFGGFPLLAALQTTLYTLKAKWSINIGKGPHYEQEYQGKGISQQQDQEYKKEKKNKSYSKVF